MEYGLTLQHIYNDSDIVELAITATNGRYTGTTELYVAREETCNYINLLAGFPKDNQDRRKLEIGATDAGSAGGGMALHFHCMDGAGHVEVDVELWEELKIGDATQRILLKLHPEPAAIDRFLEELKTLEAELRNTAFLRG